VFPVQLPPLRERRDDIPALVAHFVEIYSRRIGKDIQRIPEEVMSALCAYAWPGNIRELQNLIERAVILSDDGELPNPLPKVGMATVALASRSGTLTDTNRALILETLEASGWMIGGRGGAADRLGLKRSTLYAKMKKLGISRPLWHARMDAPGSNLETTERRATI
jgi:DNA-binding NtrC family response regulator